MSDTVPPWLDAPWSRFRAALAGRRLGHALLVAGEAGLGKRILVERIVGRLLCQSPSAQDDACGQCRGCTWLAAQTHPDIFRITPDEDSEVIKIDQIRELTARVQLTAQAGAIRVVVLDPADSMNAAAQNALLKTLEEPASAVHLILVADVPSRLLATVRSRCQVLAVTPPDSESARRWIAASAANVTGVAMALAAGHPGRAVDYSQARRAARAQSVADDLRQLADGRSSALVVARRWSDDADGHMDDAIAWLRLWSWQAGAVTLVDNAPSPASALALSDAHGRALRVRERLRSPLKIPWLLHEWLAAWQAATRRAAA